jgi:hypothetical protein
MSTGVDFPPCFASLVLISSKQDLDAISHSAVDASCGRVLQVVE